MTETFGAMLRRHRISAGLSQNQVARQSAIDPAYVSRMERDGQSLPRRAVTLALAQTLELTDSQTDRLLFAAGLATRSDYQLLYEEAARRLATIVQAVERGEPTFIRRIG